MPKCRLCDHLNPPGAPRCEKCGTWIEQTESASAQAPPVAAEEAEQPDAELESLEGQVLALMCGGKKIEAIKLYRERTGQGLKDAKEAVEALAVRHNVSPRGAGCAGVVLLLLLAAVGLAAMI